VRRSLNNRAPSRLIETFDLDGKLIGRMPTVRRAESVELDHAETQGGGREHQAAVRQPALGRTSTSRIR
jgi:hypothetical protein